MFISLIFLIGDQALAQRLESVAATAKSEVTLVAQAAVGIGIVIGGLLMAIGASQLGRMILVSGLIGAAAVFGGPMLIETIRGIVGH